MSHSYSALYVHLVFGTKNRQPLLTDVELRARLHEYIGGTSRGMKCPCFVVGGVEDHVHIIASQARTISTSDWVQEIKKASNRWMQGQGQPSFAWQEGFGAFSFEKKDIPRVAQYVGNQVEHHRKVTFEEEYMALLTEAGIDFDPRYLWTP